MIVKFLTVVIIGCFELFANKQEGFEGAKQIMNMATNLFGKINATSDDLDKTLGTIDQLTDRTQAHSKVSQSKLGKIMGRLKKNKNNNKNKNDESNKKYDTLEKCKQGLKGLQIRKQKLDEDYKKEVQEIAEEAASIKESMKNIEKNKKVKDIKNNVLKNNVSTRSP